MRDRGMVPCYDDLGFGMELHYVERGKINNNELN